MGSKKSYHQQGRGMKNPRRLQNNILSSLISLDSLFCHLTYPNKKYLKKNELTKSKRKIICNYYQLSYTHVFETFVMITNISFIEIKTLVSHHHHQTNWAFYCLLTKKTTKKRHFINKYPQNFLPYSSLNLRAKKLQESQADYIYFLTEHEQIQHKKK